jgi:N-succinyldiaminopimelate aminotransferase
VAVCCGATEGLAASILGLVNPGDEVILFEPYFDSYPACVAMAGATARYYTLEFPDFELDLEALGALFNERTRLILLNTPHNPTGKVFRRDELEAIAELCRRWDVLVLTDEVYEYLTFDSAAHVPMAGLPDMRERTLTLSSTGKTYSLTGWKIGWGIGPRPLVAAMQAAHQFLTFCAATPLQAAMAVAIRQLGDDYLAEFRAEYTRRREILLAILRDSGFEVATPAGTYFAMAAFAALDEGDDRAISRRLVLDYGVAAIPCSAFYHDRLDEGRRLLRFAFCKREETLLEAGERLRGLRP